MSKSSLLLSFTKEDSSFLKKRSKRLLLIALLAPVVARAHAMLEGATPPVGGVVRAAPARLVLRFSEGLEPRFCEVSVRGADGADRRTGDLATAPGDGRQLLVPVKTLAPGAYLVAWRAVSVDTHRTSGTYKFTVAP